jgi:CHASE2 domain-containing sensor protein
MRDANSGVRSLPQALLAFGGTVLLTSLVVTGLVIGLRELGNLEGLELSAFDGLMRARPDEGPDDRFLVVGIDDVDVQKLKQYPIEDGTLATALTKLEAQEPEVIGIDILRDVKQGDAAGRQELVNVLSQSDRIVAVCKLSDANFPGISAAPGIPEDRVGVADLPLDPGGTLRRSILISVPQAFNGKLPSEHICNYANAENQLPSLSFQMVLRYLQPKGIELEPTKSTDLKLGKVLLKRLTPKAGGYHKADTVDFQMLINYRSAKNAAKVVSLSDVLDDKVEAAAIKGKIIMVGYTTAAAKDDFYTPYSAGASDSQKMPGVVVHAQNASQILSAVLNQRPLFWFWQEWQEGLWIFGWTVLGATLAWKIRKPWLLLLGGGVAVVILIGTSYAIFLQAGWIPLIPPLLGLLISGTSVVLIDRYAATIVKTVKGFLKINVEIDEKKKQEEVAAITESDYFLNLQQKAKGLRGKDNNETSPTVNQPLATKNETAATSSIKKPAIPPTETEIETPPSVQPKPPRRSAEGVKNIASVQPLSSPEEIDYLQQLREKRNQLNSPINATESVADAGNSETIPTQLPTETQPVTEAEQQDDLEYIAQLQRRGKRMRDGKK